MKKHLSSAEPCIKPNRKADTRTNQIVLSAVLDQQQL